MHVVDMTTVSREIDPTSATASVGMADVHASVEPTYTVADISGHHYKGGPMLWPIDIAVVENFEINVLGDDQTMK